MNEGRTVLEKYVIMSWATEYPLRWGHGKMSDLVEIRLTTASRVFLLRERLHDEICTVFYEESETGLTLNEFA